MAKKIIQCNIKTIDENNHIRFYSINDVHVDSIKFVVDTPEEKKVTPKPKETITKKFKTIIKKKNY